jgi:hypothetical protein
MQSSSSSRPFKPGLIGASPITDAISPRSSMRSERHRAKVEVAGAIPAVDANLAPCLSSYRASFVNSWPCASTRCESDPGLQFHGDHDVTAASRPVKAFVPVRIRLVTPFGRAPALRWAEGCSLSPHAGVVAHRERAAGRKFGVAGRVPLAKPRICASTCPSLFAEAQRHCAPAQNRIRRAGATLHCRADSPVVQMRENTRRNSGDVGSIPIGRAHLDGPLSLGYR